MAPTDEEPVAAALEEPADDVPVAVDSVGVSKTVKRLHSSHDSGMESSVFRFKNVNFVVGKGDAKKNILTDVSGTVKFGREYYCIMTPE